MQIHGYEYSISFVAAPVHVAVAAVANTSFATVHIHYIKFNDISLSKPPVTKLTHFVPKGLYRYVIKTPI